METIKRRMGIKMLSFFMVMGMLTGCDLSSDVDPCTVVNYIYVGASGVTGPSTATVNQEITLNVSFSVENSCGTFHSFYQEGLPNESTITVLAQYSGCDCDDLAVTRVAPYKFKATVAGTYVLKFKITNTTFITQTIVVSA